MAGSKAKKSKTEPKPEVWDEPEVWVEKLGRLIEDLRTWSNELDWSTRVITKTMRESDVPPYEAPALLLQKEFTRLLVEPYGRRVVGGGSGLDVYVMPEYEDTAQICDGSGRWVIIHDDLAQLKAGGGDSRTKKRLTRANWKSLIEELKNNAQ